MYGHYLTLHKRVCTYAEWRGLIYMYVNELYIEHSIYMYTILMTCPKYIPDAHTQHLCGKGLGMSSHHLCVTYLGRYKLCLYSRAFTCA